MSIEVRLIAGAMAIIAVACSDAQKADPCPSGICGDDDPSSVPGVDGGKSTNDGGCVPSWTCTPWQTSGGSAATRVCTDTAQCGTSVGKPTETTTLPLLDRPWFECKVFPVLQHKCAQLGCHGTEAGRALRVYARGRLRITGEILTETGCLSAGKKVPSESCTGSIECICFTGRHTKTELDRNYDSARGFALDANGDPIAAGQESTSDLVAQPVVGGKAHAGVHLFRSSDPDYQVITDWIGGKALGSTCNHPYN